MPTLIRILPDGLVNKIAAGEVVERPASVVKELVENAVDAGASRIEVEVRGGGKGLIRVRDDGSGMVRDDALLCLERHATSKIRSDADLFSIRSLGFRGEALPSIAEVSRFDLLTCARGAGVGTRVRVEGGVLRDVSDAPAAAGTEVQVRNLFFNVPVRLKFLRGDGTELSHVTEAVVRQALARPEVAFAVTGSQGEILHAPRADSLRRRASDLLGRTVAAALHEVEGRGGAVSVQGLVSDPSLTRSTREGLYLYVNGRFVRDRLASAAVMEAYQGVIPRGRYPVVVLFLDLPADAVDVNVHPSKVEVRFVDGHEVYRAVHGPVRDAFRDARAGVFTTPRPAPQVESGGDGDAGPVQSGLRWGSDAWRSRWMDAAVPPGDPGVRGPPPLPDEVDAGGVPAAGSSRPAGEEVGMDERWPPLAPVATPVPVAEPPGAPVTQYAGGSGRRFQDLNVLAQYDTTYLLCQDGTDLVLLDQHAAHERVTFERIRQRACGAGEPPQLLLVPEVLDLPRAQAEALAARRDLLEELGLEIDEYGRGALAVKAIPPGVSPARVRRLLSDLAQELLGGDVPRAVEALRYHLASLMACHCSVRAHDRLDRTEAMALLRQLDAVDFSFACPHGRPLLVRFPRRDVEKWFGRA